ncbi:hypothetical protein Bca52824_049303 [Brassica carinata]|uniref:Uncharacterized protein n=1 Tax=Brassica carinata TaxID=52824 RepID=A0A8X7RII1_BRACI|nr:hypothetical protein Bca52824_049303 [Brassica carinata]
MAGASSLQQAPDPPDPGADNLGSGSPLHSSQFPPLSHSPKPQSLGLHYRSSFFSLELGSGYSALSR